MSKRDDKVCANCGRKCNADYVEVRGVFYCKRCVKRSR